MSLEILLKQLEQKNIRIALVEGKLKAFDQQKNLTPQLMAQLKQHKDELVALLNDKKGLTPSDFPHANIDQAQLDQLLDSYKGISKLYTTVPMQQGMLFHSMVDGSGKSYTTQNAFKLTGQLNVEAFKSAWQKLLQRHDVFRTCFVDVGADNLQQLVLSSAELPFHFVNWCDKSELEQSRLFEQYCKSDKEAGFNFAQPPLLRLSVIQLSETTFNIVWTHHHALIDGWCRHIVLDDVVKLYAELTEQAPPLAQVIHPYEHYVAWLQKQNQGQAHAYWQQYLNGFMYKAVLMIDRLPVKPTNNVVERIIFQLDEHKSAKLKALAMQQSCTVNAIFQAAWSYVLHTYSGLDDIVFGATISGRPPELEGVQDMVGLFINTIPMRVDFSQGQTLSLAQLLEQLKQTYSQCSDFGYYPLSQIQKCVDEGLSGRLFDSIIVYANHPSEINVEHQGKDNSGITLESLATDEYTNYSIGLAVNLHTCLNVKLTYHTDRIPPQAAQRLAEHLEHVLNQFITAQPHSLVCEVELSANMSDHITVSVPQVEVTTQNELIHSAFERHAAEHPEALVMLHMDKQVTYQSLNEEADHVAFRLIAQGVSSEDVVAVCAPRSIELLISILGILKAGAAYVVLDPKFPEARQQFIVDDAGVKCILVKSIADCLATAKHVMPVEYLESNTAPSELVNRPTCQKNNAAYVMYTSGSSGTPKGVVVEHGQVLNFFGGLRGQLNQLSLSEQSPWLASASFTFDASVKSLYMLGVGRPLLLPEDHQVGDPEALHQLIKKHGVELYNGTPQMAEGLLSFVEDDSTIHLNWIVGGEDISQKSWDRLAQYCEQNNTAALNAYGPTETTINVCSALITSGEKVNIGHLLPNYNGHVLDKYQRPVPVGIPGELYVSGPSVARGYLNQPKLTEDAFPKHLAGAITQQRMYRTGDKVIQFEDGQLKFIERLDGQIKLRGLRIELGEVEQVFYDKLGVEKAIATVTTLQSGHKTLVAFVKLTTPETMTEPEMQSALGQFLPQYMIPSRILSVSEWPVTVAGKTDKAKLLSSLNQVNENSVRAGAAPINSTEVLLVDLWKQVLKIDEVGVEDDFFALGGDSILSMLLISKAKRAQLPFTFRQLFACKTIKALAQVVEKPARKSKRRERPVVVKGTQPLLPIQSKFFTAKADLDIQNHFNQALLLNTPEGFDSKMHEKVVEALFRRHDALRLKFNNDEGTWQGVYQVLSKPLIQSSFETIKLDAAPGREREKALQQIAEQKQRSLNIEQGPLFSSTYFEFGDQEPGRWLLVCHHLIVDGVSWRILLQDIESAYLDVKRTSVAKLPPKSASYQQWAQYIKGYLNTASGQEDLAFLQSYFNQHQSVTGIPSRAVDEFADTLAESQNAMFTLNEQVTRTLLSLDFSALGVSLLDVIVSGLYSGLKAAFNQDAFCVALENHGRLEADDAPDVYDTVGWFTNVHPIFINSNGAVDTALVNYISEQKIPRLGIAFGLLKYQHIQDCNQELRALQQRVYECEPDILFNYLGQADQSANEQSFFSIANESSGTAIHPDRRRPNKLIINAIVRNGKLQVSVNYQPKLVDSESIETLGNGMITQLNTLCLQLGTKSEKSHRHPLSSYSGKVLSQLELDDVLVQLNSSSLKRNLFFFHPLGGSVNCYQSLAEHLADQGQVFGLQQPDLFTNCYTESIEELARFYAQLLNEKQPLGEFYLFGWSAGARIAYEVAQQLIDMGRVVKYFASFDQAPKLFNSDFRQKPDYPYFQLRNMLENKTSIDWNVIWKYPKAQILAQVEAALKSQGFIPEGLDAEQVSRYLKAFCTLSDTMESYQASPIELDVTLFKTAVTPSNSILQPVDESLNWRKFTSNHVTIVGVKGRHDDMVLAPYAQELAHKVRADLLLKKSVVKGMSWY